MSNNKDQICVKRALELPSWVQEYREAWEQADFSSKEARMTFVLDLSRKNIEHKSGGPFSAAVFTRDSHKLLSIGLNRVVPEHASMAHAEIMALLMAQERLQSFDLGSQSEALEMVINAQPCIQCYGAIIWSGISHVLFAASGADVERLTGFDEGPSPANWEEEWLRRGITVEYGYMKNEACTILASYKDSGALVYNSTNNQLVNNSME